MNDIFTILLIASLIAYAAEIIFLRIGMDRATNIERNLGYQPSVSIIVAARNEEEYIEECLTSLAAVDYPAEKLEIIVVNDHSSDRTESIVRSLTARYPAIKLISSHHGKGNLRGKANALAQGISVSSGEILMFTDADCTVPKSWVSETVQAFDQTTGVVGGFTLLQSHRMFEAIQALDWIFLFGIASGTAGWNIPLTAIGNNIAVRRRAYDQVGGFENIQFSVTEDYSLVQAILQKTEFTLRFPINTNAVVQSRPCKNVRQLFRQKQRWGVGGLDMIMRGLVIMTVGWIVKLLVLLGVFFMSFPLWMVFYLAKLSIDFLFLEKPLRKFGARSLLRYLPPFEIYYAFYVIVLPIVALLSKNVVWKDRRL